MSSLWENGGKDLGLDIPNSVLIQLNRLENLLRDKERELGAAQNEIKALKGTEFLKDRAIVELSNELKKFEEKVWNVEKQMEDKNLEIKKLIDEKKAALSAQFAAEATLRRLHASQKDDDSVSVGALIAPLEAEIRMYKNWVAVLQEDKKAKDRLIKSKAASLIEVEKNVQSALEKALMVENLQNQNLEFKRQIEICQEENKFLEKTNRQKVTEVERLSQTIHELEECILVGGAAANAVRDYQRQVAELNEEKKTLEREVAKAKICANRVATVVANEWKDEGDKVMPVRQWLEERKYLQGEMQKLKDKLAISERSAKAEAQLKDKFMLRLRTLEEGLKKTSTSSANQTTTAGKNFRSSSPSGLQRPRSASQPRASLAASKLSETQRPNSATGNADAAKSLRRSDSPIRAKFNSSENMFRKNLWATRRKYPDEGGKENTAKDINVHGSLGEAIPQENDDSAAKRNGCDGKQYTDTHHDGCDHMVSGFLYDRLQKEVIVLRKSQEEKDEELNSKEDEIKLLQRKVDALTKAVEVEAKNMRRIAAAREKEALQKPGDAKQRNKTANMVRRTVKHSQISTN